MMRGLGAQAAARGRSLQEEFDARGPWITRFEFGDAKSGGTYDAIRDPRVLEAVRRFAPLGRVLELGCLEGGHTVTLARNATSVLAVDARPENLERARWVAELYGIQDRVRFLEADVETWSPSEPVDLLFCVGVLYHLADPIAALERFASWAPRLVLWTHVGAPGHRQEEAGFGDRLSGLHDDSPWPTRDDVMAVIDDVFDEAEASSTDPGPPAIGEGLLVYARRF